MNRNHLIILGAVVAIAVAAFFLKAKPADQGMEPSPSVSVSGSPVKGVGYNNKYMSLDLPAGWKVADVGTSGAVNVTKGNWILYINPAAAQASGVEGGRFDEYAGGAPGVETVLGGIERPRSGYECGTKTIKQGVARIEDTVVVRHDFFTGPGALAGCRVPSDAPAAWFLSIIGNQAGFNEVSTVTNKKLLPAPNDFPVRQFAITMTYKAATVNDLPRLGTKELNAGLADMDAIVSTLVFH